MKVIALTPLSGSFCAADAGEPLRGHTLTYEGNRQRAYLIGAVSHRAADRAVVIEVSLSREAVSQALAASLQRAFPGLLTDEVRRGIDEVLRLAAVAEVGSIVRVTTTSWRVSQPTADSRAAAAALAPVTRAMFDQLRH